MEDRIMKFLAYNGKFSVICADTTKMVEKARNIHDLSPVSTAALGRMITMASILGTEMKNKQDKLTLQIKGSGPIGMMVAVANNFPKVKAFVTNPQLDLPLNDIGKLDVGQAVGNQGYINVIKNIGMKEPYIGISPIVSGEIAEDFAKYFVNSEQRESAVALGVLVDKNGVKSSGGYLIQAMPGSTEEEISKIEQEIYKAGAISKMLGQNLSLVEIAKKITGDENIRVLEENIEPIYECDCSKENLSQSLITIGEKELKDIIENEGEAELVCHFCNKKYQFSKEELEKLLNFLKIQKN